MANSLEIFQNSLLKLVVRSGPDSDRASVVLDVGELGAATDTKRLYVGDGTTAGGILVGNVFNGARASVTSGYGSPKAGDYAFDTDKQVLYVFNGGDAGVLANWRAVGAVFSADNTTISLTGSKVKVGTLSAYNISSDALGNSLTISSGRVALSSTVLIDRVISATSLALPKQLNINSTLYTFPSAALSANTFLNTDAFGNLTWKSISTLLSSASATLTVGSGLSAFVNGVGTTSALLLTSSNVEIRGIFIPTAHVTFNQGGAITRSARISGVEIVPFSAVSGEVINGASLIESTSPYDSNVNNTTGAFRIKTTDPFTTGTVVVDVQAKNASYRYDNNGLYIASPILNFKYKVEGTNSILVMFYAPATYISRTTNNNVAYTGPNILTPGYADLTTQFSVTVYG